MRWTTLTACWITVLLPCAAVADAPSVKPRLRILVPAYFYPAGRGLAEWDKLFRSSARADVVAIMNPASGPGSQADPNYIAIVERARQSGVTLIGYVTVSYAKRPAA